MGLSRLIRAKEREIGICGHLGEYLLVSPSFVFFPFTPGGWGLFMSLLFHFTCPADPQLYIRPIVSCFSYLSF